MLLLAGPIGLLLVVGVWAGLFVLGWGLLLWPQLEQGFHAEGLGGTGFWDAIQETEQQTGSSAGDDGWAERLYAELTSRVVTVERDLVALPVTYYLAESDERFALKATIPYLLEFADRDSRRPRP